LEWAQIALAFVESGPGMLHAFKDATPVDEQERNGRNDDDCSYGFPVFDDQRSRHEDQRNDHVIFPEYKVFVV